MNLASIKKALRPMEKEKGSLVSLSSGSTLLNLACTGKPRACFYTGHYYYFVGDSNSGKTFLTLTCFAEACMNRNFDSYRLIFDNAEDGALMDFEKYFGSKAAKRIEPPTRKNGYPVYSHTIQDFFFNLDDAKKEGIPFIYLLDSMDALSSSDEKKTFDKQKIAYRKGRKMPGSYGDGKAKLNSSGIRQIMSFIRASGSILIIISQTRDNIEAFGYGDKKTRSGGKALSFYTTLEMWTSQAGHIMKEINDKKRELGINSQIRIKKNRISGKDRTVVLPIYHSHGIDDLGSCIEYLLDEGHWKKVNGRINARELNFSGSKEQLIQHVEENELQRELQNIVKECWDKIEAMCSINRVKRYE